MPLPIALPKSLPNLFGRSRESVCYEVSLAIAPERSDEFDEWLLGHVREMLAFPGFQDARVYRDPQRDEEGRERRVVSYEVRSRRELDSYLHTHAKRMRAEGVQRFGKALAASRDIVPLSEYQPGESLQLLLSEEDISGGLPICGNCHNPVEGRFCKLCGQEDRTYLLSLKELVGEFLGELTNFDSRFFRTLKPLLFKPGLLTLEYIRGRRQHYFPPIRLYIIISILFFFVAAVMTDSGLADANFGEASIDGDQAEQKRERQEAIAEIEAALPDAGPGERYALQAALQALRAKQAPGDEEPQVESSGAPDKAAAESSGDVAAIVPAKESPQEGGEPSPPVEGTEDASAGKTVEEPGAANGPGPDAEALMRDIESTLPEAREPGAEAQQPTLFGFAMPNIQVSGDTATASGWGSEEMNERMERGAVAIKENPRAFVRTVIDNIPSMMLIFLPLIALALKILYVFSGRYYVEHLIFSLHTHSAVFIILLFWMLVGELADSFSPLERVMGWITAAVWIYIPVYLYKSMRRVYGQGHFFTTTKFFLLSICYIIAASVTSIFLFVAAVYQQA
ncbi:MAG: DUF4286 family protein [Gammaproteobacteria bacterium]|nr:DUF4286 family protein [Gammaproteobacteria bacterium]